MRTRKNVALVAAVCAAACGGDAGGTDGGASHDAPPTDDGLVRSDAPQVDAPSALPVPTYAATPTQTLVPPAGIGQSYGVLVAISADGTTLATFDDTSLYVFTRASSAAPFGATPTQKIPAPANVSVLGVGLSLSADGGLLACAAVLTSGVDKEILLYTREGAQYGTTPAVITATSPSNEIEVAALAPDGSELAYAGLGGAVSILPRSGSAYSATPAQTIPPPTGASEFFGGEGALSSDGTTYALGDIQGGGSGEVLVYRASTADGTFAATAAQTLTAPAGIHDFGNGVALRTDAAELVECGINPTHVGIYQLGSAGYALVQTLAPPTGASQEYGISSGVAADGTLVVGDYGAHFYVYAPE